MHRPLTIEVGYDDHGIVLCLAGEIDAATVTTLERALVGIDPGAGRITLHLAAVSFLDSSGINLLLRTHRALTLDLRELVITDPSPPVLHVLEIVGLTDVLHLS